MNGDEKDVRRRLHKYDFIHILETYAVISSIVGTIVLIGLTLWGLDLLLRWLT